jgi:hypothetical protein
VSRRSLLALLLASASDAGWPCCWAVAAPRALLLRQCLTPITITRVFAPYCRAWQGRLRVGVLPVALFCDGYSYFHKVRGPSTVPIM